MEGAASHPGSPTSRQLDLEQVASCLGAACLHVKLLYQHNRLVSSPEHQWLTSDELCSLLALHILLPSAPGPA